MSETTPQPTLLRFLAVTAVEIAVFTGILLGIREGFALAIPAGSCAGTPVAPTIYVLSAVFFIHFAFPKNSPGWRGPLRFAAVMLAVVSGAVLATRLAAGCTPLADWFPEGRIIVEALLMNGILIPLAHLHRDFIEPRWAWAMGEGGESASEGEDMP